MALPAFYDDGGLSGGTMDQPALKRLLEDVSAGRIDIIVVYKVDRLTRSLSDFARIVDTLDRHKVSFVSVTQHFNTTSSMGRMTLNVLLSFAQFEREIAGERIRDKIAASKRKGMWMGGTVPFGYHVKDRRLVIVEGEAATLWIIFETYAELGTVEALMERLAASGITHARERAGDVNADGGARANGQGDDWLVDEQVDDESRACLPHTSLSPAAFSRPALYHMLSNPLYIGKVRHKGQVYDGLHQPIIDEALWTMVQVGLAANRINRTSGRRSRHPSLLVGKIETDDGQGLTPTHAVKRGVRYRYYATVRSSSKDQQSPAAHPEVIRVPAAAIERIVIERIQALLRSPAELADLLQPLNLSASQLRQAIQTAQEIADSWPSKSASDQRAILQTILVKVRLGHGPVELCLSRRGLAQSVFERGAMDAGQADSRTMTLSAKTGDDIVIIKSGTGLEPKGNGLRLIIKDTSEAEPNTQLAPLIAEAFKLRDTLLNGPHDSIEAMSKALQLGKGYLTSRIRLTFLSPRLITKILAGDVSATLSPTRLLEASKQLPAKWAEQDHYFTALSR